MPIKINDLSYFYAKDSIMESKALDNVNLNIDDHKIISIIGQTGSGKSSLIQHLNAILIPSSGSVQVDEFIVDKDSAKKSYKNLRQKVGVVFQFSEYQLFEETIIKDVMFGPLNFNVEKEEAKQRAIKALELVGIDKSYYQRSPFELSGGQKRRVAIAGILAMQPDIIILDEPTAGLDPQGAIEMMNIFLDLNKNANKTIIIVSHDMDFVYQYASEVILLDKGQVITHMNKDLFFKSDYINQYNIDLPILVQYYQKFVSLDYDKTITFEYLIKQMKERYQDVK